MLVLVLEIESPSPPGLDEDEDESKNNDEDFAMDPQQLITIAIAALAAAYLLRRSIVSLRADKPGCGSCEQCPTVPEQPGLPVRRQLYSLASKPDGTD